MKRRPDTTPCPPPPLALAALAPAPAPYCAGPHSDSTTTITTSVRYYTADFAQPQLLSTPRWRPATHKKLQPWDPATEIWVDDRDDVAAAAAAATLPAPPVAANPVPPAASRPRAPRKSAIFAQPAQRIPISLAPNPQDNGLDDMLQPRRRRVSALLADRAVASADHVQRKSKRSELAKDPRRRTIYVPSDDTTIMTIHPGCFPHPARRPRSPDLGLDLVTLSEEESDQPLPAIKQPHVPRKSLAAAPKRAPLQHSSRPLQGVSFVQDVVGKTLGKENIPPGMSLQDSKHPRPSAARAPVPKSRVKLAARPEVRSASSSRPTASTASSAAKAAVARKRTGSDSAGSPSKAIRTARTAATARQPLRETGTKRQTARLASNSSSPFHTSRSPPQVLRRNRADKPPSSLRVPRVSQTSQSNDKYPVLPEDLDKPELYEDSWLSYQEISITQLANKLLRCVDLTLQGKQDEEGALRRKLLVVYQDASISLLHKRLQASLLYGALRIPKDVLAKALRLKDDVGLRRKYLDLFVNSYEPCVLRAAAEAIVGRECPISSRLSSGSTTTDRDQRQKRAERKAIEGFLDTFLIRNEDAVRVKTGFGSIASIARGRDKCDDFGSQSWSWRRTTLRSLMLILLLDMSKAKNIVNIPLFQPTSSHKSSNAILQELASMVLPSLGDLSRPLGHLDYHLLYVQYPLQEYKYHIANLATDLRDGVLLTRLVELLLYPPTTLSLQKDVTVTMPTGELLTSCFNPVEKGSWVLSQHLKFPCVGRTQKLYNVQVALSALEGVRGAIEHAVKDITAEDIVDGHREKTLGFLWALVGKWGLETLIDWTELAKETNRFRIRFYTEQSEDYQGADGEDDSEIHELSGLERHTALLRDWARAIARLRGLRVANLTTSFADGRILEAIVDEYTACFPDTSTVADLPVASNPSTCSLPTKLRSIGCSSAFVSLFASASAAPTRPIPSKDFTTTTLAFFASRLLPASRARRAAFTLQRWYRLRLARREASKRIALMRLAADCATVVQTRERVVGAAIVLQRAWRNVLDARISKLVCDITAFQSLTRSWAVRKAVSASSSKNKVIAKRVERIRGGW